MCDQKHVFQENRNSKDHDDIMEVGFVTKTVFFQVSHKPPFAPRSRVKIAWVFVIFVKITCAIARTLAVDVRMFKTLISFQDYYKYVATDKGALLFAVYRGKVSEGMDFKDQQARAVITVSTTLPHSHRLMFIC